MHDTEALRDSKHIPISNKQSLTEFDLEEPSYGELGGENESQADEDGIEIVEGTAETREVVEAKEEDVFDENLALPAYDAYMARAQGTSSLEQASAQEVVIGRDTRTKIEGIERYPWRCICSLQMLSADGQYFIGTGWLVGPRTVITAGHCVFLHNHGGWPRSITVIPGRNGARKPFKATRSQEFWSVRGWVDHSERSYDYGAIILPEDYPIGNQIGYFGYLAYDNSSLSGKLANLSGYPGDKPSGTQWWGVQRFKEVTGTTLVYDIDTFGGQSGAPVWRVINGKRYAVGIHTNGYLTGNSATRITRPVFNNITMWKNQVQ